MRVLFFTTGTIGNISNPGIYSDLLRCFANNGHEVYIVSSREKRFNRETELIDEGMCKHLYVKIGNLTKTNLIEKGISTLTIESKYLNAVKEYFGNVKFDLVLCSTPPITLVKAIEYVKKRDSAKTYLLLKDIFPQNAIDLGILKTSGLKGLIYKHFRNKEKRLYAISDKIGCMSQANCDFILKHNPEIDPKKVEICPNSIEVIDMRIAENEREEMRKNYDIPLEKKVFVYGGNLGKPQGISFVIDCLKAELKNKQAYFLIVGDGTEFGVLEKFFNEFKPKNMKLMKRLPKEDYDKMVAACDVGMIFLDYRFTIPNFPSRLLSYMQAGLPVLACTDSNTDVGKVITNGGFGWWCESNSVSDFDNTVKEIMNSNLKEKGNNAFVYLKEHYSADVAYKVIMKELD